MGRLCTVTGAGHIAHGVSAYVQPLRKVPVHNVQHPGRSKTGAASCKLTQLTCLYVRESR